MYIQKYDQNFRVFVDSACARALATSMRRKESPVVYGRVTVDPTNLSQAIANRRMQFGWSLREVAERAGVSHGTVHKLERGNHRIQLDSFLLVLAVLDLAPHDLLSVSDDKRTVPGLSRIEAELLKLTRSKDVPKAIARIAVLLQELSLK